MIFSNCLSGLRLNGRLIEIRKFNLIRMTQYCDKPSSRRIVKWTIHDSSYILTQLKSCVSSILLEISRRHSEQLRVFTSDGVCGSKFIHRIIRPNQQHRHHHSTNRVLIDKLKDSRLIGTSVHYRCQRHWSKCCIPAVHASMSQMTKEALQRARALTISQPDVSWCISLSLAASP